MNTILISLTLIFSSSVFANSYLLYNVDKNHTQIIEESYKTHAVFTPAERIGIPQSIANALTIELSDEELKSFKLRYGHKFKIESNPTQHTLSVEPYEKFQWALNNTGEGLLQWQSDIDAEILPGKIGEDIGIADLKEDKNNKIKVAVIDSGIDLEHPEFKNQVRNNPLECQELQKYQTCMNTQADREQCHAKYFNKDMDGNGYPMDCNGWNLNGTQIPGASVTGTPTLNDSNGHGTHVASIIGAARDGKGIAGVIQNVELIPVKVSTSSSRSGAQAATDKIAKAVRYAIHAGAQVINLSLGWRFEQDSLLMREMIKLALEKNILVVAGAGNDGHEAPVYPCSYEGVICVASHTVDGTLSSFSNYGAHIDLAGPGTKILGAWPTGKRSRFFTDDDNYEYLSGTSQAAPYVSGVLARLLNLGYSAQEAKIKLLAGTRASSSSYIRHGNVDLKKAALTKSASFIAPQNKSPALIKWETGSDKRSFLLKLENTGLDAQNVKITIDKLDLSTQKKLKVLTQSIRLDEFKAGSTHQSRIFIEAPYESSGDFLFEITIKSKDEDKKYHLQAKAISIIDGEENSEEQLSLPISNGDNLDGANFNFFKDYTGSSTQDLLVQKTVNGAVFLNLLKEENGSYTQGSWQKLEIKNPVFLNLSKVDIDGDSNTEYVITLIEAKSSSERITHFRIFDENFNIKKVLISPENKFDNDLVALPGSFTWLKRDNTMVPAWVGVGKRPESERPVTDFWSEPEPELDINRIYTLTPKGIATIELPKQRLPLHFLYQNEASMKEGKVVVISSDSFGFYKNYSAYNLGKEISLIKEFTLTPYIDLLNTRPMPVAASIGNNAFFYDESLSEQKLVSFEADESGLNINYASVTSFDPKIPVLRILAFDGERAIYQTQNHLGYKDTKLAARTGTKRIKHSFLKEDIGLYLRSADSPGLGSELIKIEDETIVRKAKAQLLGAKSCVEAGKSTQDILFFVCPESAKVLKVFL
ncbi:MAG: S8 family serine peptidase [Bacteriovoracaceae bacterium]|nr:S8 family serine peptidase [Bacteriovoracaceae bacterium]